MTSNESHRREKQAFWNGLLLGAAVWTLIALVIVAVFEAMA